MRVRRVREGIGYRIDQVCQPRNRHLVDVRMVQALPASQRVEEVLVLTPVELVSSKVLSMVGRPETAKGLIDRADLRRLLLTFPELKTREGPVRHRLHAAGASPEVLAAWDDVVAQRILPDAGL